MELKINNTGLDQTVIEKTGELVVLVTKRLKEVSLVGGYENKESFLNLPFDEELFNSIKKIVSEKINSNLKYVLVIGIGGSNLGAKAVYDALQGHFDLLNTTYPKMIFVDTNNSKNLVNLKSFLNTEIESPSDIVVNIISKSGGTVETLVNAEFVVDVLSKKFGDISDRLVVTTDEDSELWKESDKKNISVMSIPKSVGGRYSVFSAVGLLPLAFAGFDIYELLDGAKKMRARCLDENIIENPAIMSAVVLFLSLGKNKVINDNFFFNGELESLGKWYRQLMGESIGKNEKGITPTVSIGSTDLHSVGQLYIGGIKDKIISFIKSKEDNGVDIQSGLFSNLIEGVNGKNSNDILDAIFKGVEIAYSKKGVPFMEIILDNISPKTIGEFMQFKMMEIVYLGALLDVNVFDQPDVEAYKKETKRILAE